MRITFREIPEENTLHDLSGKVIKLKDPQIVKQFDGLDKNKQAPAEEAIYDIVGQPTARK